MAISAVILSALGTTINEFGSSYFGKGVNSNSPLLKSGCLKTINPEGDFVVQLYPVANHSTGFTLDGGRLPKGGSGKPLDARAQPVAIVSKLTQGRAASKAPMKNKERTKLLDMEMKMRARDTGRVLNRALIGGSVNPQASATWSGTAADSTVSVDFLDISMFREGMAVDFIDVSATLAYVVRVKTVTPAAIGANSSYVAGTVEFINDVVNPATDAVVALGATAVATGDSFQVRGATAGFGAASTFQGALPISFDDIAGSGATAALMGQTPSSMGVGYGWKGVYKNLAAVYSQEAALQFHSHLCTIGDEAPDTIVCHPQLAAAHAASGDFHGAQFGVSAGLSAARTRSIEKSTDKYGNVYEDSGLRLGGAKVVQDPNCQAGRMIMFASGLTKLAWWAEISPDNEAGNPVLLGRDYYTNDVQFSGLVNLVTEARNSVGILDGVTSL